MERSHSYTERREPYNRRPHAYTIDSAIYRRELFLPEPVNKLPPLRHRHSLRMEERPAEKHEDEDKDDKTFSKVVLKFMGYTSAHGIGRLADSKTIFWKIFWTLVCMGAVGMFIYQAYGLFELFLSRPVSTSVKISFEKKLPFPAVTICNLNMIRKDVMPSQLKEKIEKTYGDGTGDSGSGYSGSGDSGSGTGQARRRRNVPPVTGSGSGVQPTPATNDDDYYYDDSAYQDYQYDGSGDGYNSAEDEEDLDDDYPEANEVSLETKLRTEISQLIGGLDSADLYYNGHLFSDLVQNCTWKGLDCKSGNLSKSWIHSWNYQYGNCFTFNSGFNAEHKEVRVLKTTKPGPSQGLILHLNIEQDQYIGAISLEAGVRVVLHPQGNVPFPLEEGFSVSPGRATSVGLKKTKIIRLDRFENQSCLAQNQLPKENIYRRYRNVTQYSQQACLNSCLGLSQWFRCKCSEIAYPSKGEPCDVFNTTTRNCLKFVKNLFINDKLKCLSACRQPCTEEVIQKTISSSEWPSKAYRKFLSSQHGTSNGSDSAMLLNIFYNELNYERIEEEFSYGMIKLLADIGGQLGLWVGISVITCCEVLELFIKFFSHIIKKCNSASQAQIGEVPPYGYR